MGPKTRKQSEEVEPTNQRANEPLDNWNATDDLHRSRTEKESDGQVEEIIEDDDKSKTPIPNF